ncbi:unnamed protein product [Arabidopsis thaliana]|uniref:Uncharacterized protein n=1 Tax=Arabidopsis thaliana TaxID=3702 RepID=A0A5S9XGQ2_ARATH|nr:unnamed protein product [Arabidopsis thaliana]
MKSFGILTSIVPDNFSARVLGTEAAAGLLEERALIRGDCPAERAATAAASVDEVGPPGVIGGEGLEGIGAEVKVSATLSCTVAVIPDLEEFETAFGQTEIGVSTGCISTSVVVGSEATTNTEPTTTGSRTRAVCNESFGVLEELEEREGNWDMNKIWEEGSEGQEGEAEEGSGYHQRWETLDSGRKHDHSRTSGFALGTGTERKKKKEHTIPDKETI